MYTIIVVHVLNGELAEEEVVALDFERMKLPALRVRTVQSAVG